MKRGFYPKLAWIGVRNNRRLYLPYLLTCIGMVMMFYIVRFLYASNVLESLSGGRTMQSMMDFGSWVIGIFALIFLFYTNSFLIRRRKKEFGLYNILGRGKWNLARVLLWESVMIAAASLAAGLLLGTLLSKFAELVMMYLMQAQADFTLAVDPQAILSTLGIFLAIFALLLLNTLRQIHLTNPIELLHSENTGEKPPKANWFLAVAGVILLAIAYYMAVVIEDPVAAMLAFFVAVVMVIVATYLLFVAGSVTLCRALQRNKRYYYKTNHFVSVSSMVYRMKRNGAGLASICILCTMVLVMLSSTVCLYIGSENVLSNRYPRDIGIEANTSSVQVLEDDVREPVRQMAAETAEEHGQTPENIMDYRVAALSGGMDGERFLTGNDSGGYSTLWQVFVLPVEDYNRLMGTDETVQDGEALIYTSGESYGGDTLSIDGGPSWTLRHTDQFLKIGLDDVQIIPSIYLFVNDFQQTADALMALNQPDQTTVTSLYWYYRFDLQGDDEAQREVQGALVEKLEAFLDGYNDPNGDSYAHIYCDGLANNRAEFYGLYGGLFFLGILLGIVFLFAAVLMIYYKQISEGYEDQSRFEIMQKVGMTKREIRKSINSQILTVFFLPLLAAGLHLGFAFPIIRRLLLLFALTDVPLLAMTTVGCFLAFALLYLIVYRVTSKAYYNIVSGAREE